MKKRIIAFISVFVMLTALIPSSALAQSIDRDIASTAAPGYDFSEDVWILFNGEIKRETFVLENKTDTLTLDDLNISLFGRFDGVLNTASYDLHIGFFEGWDDVSGKPIFRDAEAPYGLHSDPNGTERGWVKFDMYAEAKKGGGYEGITDLYEFVIADRHCLSDNIPDIDFGKIYKRDIADSPHPFYSVPLNRLQAPRVYDAGGNLLDVSQYAISYFEREEESAYSEDKPLGGMPLKAGRYFVRIEGKEPYYGVSYVDFDIIEAPELYALVRGSEKRYYDNNTIFVPAGDSVDIRFGANGSYGAMIIGWVSNDLEDEGFNVADDPVWFDDDPNAYAHISAEGLEPGTRGELVYNWYRLNDVFYDDSFHWDTAAPLWSGIVYIEVEPGSYDYLLGDADGDGEVTVTDATVLQRACAEMETGFDDAALMRGDVDGSGNIDIVDATYISRWLADISIPCDVNRPMKNA